MIRALNKIDDQGFKWGQIRFNRQSYRQERLESFQSHRSQEQVLNKKTTSKKDKEGGQEYIKRQFYRHRYTKREERVMAGHF
jgi:hypothetical protein